MPPGPRLITEKPDLFWGLVMSFWVGNIMLLILNIPLIGIWIRVLAIPYHWLYPAVMMFVCIGAYSVSNGHFEVLMVMVFAIFGYIVRLLGFPPAPLLIGMVLGPLMEEHLRRALVLSQGDFMVFIERPLSGSFMAVTALLLGWAMYSLVRGQRKERAE